MTFKSISFSFQKSTRLICNRRLITENLELIYFWFLSKHDREITDFINIFEDLWVLILSIFKSLDPIAAGLTKWQIIRVGIDQRKMPGKILP